MTNSIEWLTGLGMGMFCLLVMFGPFLAMIGFIVYLFRRAQAEQARIDKLPISTVAASVVAKRMETSGMSDGPVRTKYYATFELVKGERLELQIQNGFGLLSEGDYGLLTYQGPRFKDFRREGVS